MRKIKIIGIVLLFMAFTMACNSKSNKLDKNKIEDGDIIFQESDSTQNEELKIITGSKYTHVGIVFKSDSKIYVYEAVGPVKYTPLKKWINQGIKKHFVIKRLKNSEKYLTKANLQKMKSAGKKFMGKAYDIQFLWSDKKLYCSELVWKIYKRSIGIEIGKLQQFKDFDLSHKIVKRMIARRFHSGKLPMEEKVISPVQMFNSPLLETIYSN